MRRRREDRMDQALFDFLADWFRGQTGVDMRSDHLAVARLREAAEVAKIELTTSTTTHIMLPYLTVKGDSPLHFDMELTRAELERLVAPIRAMR